MNKKNIRTCNFCGHEIKSDQPWYYSTKGNEMADACDECHKKKQRK